MGAEATRLVIVRHGKPLVDRRLRVDRSGYRQFWADYEAGSLYEPQEPPAKLLELVADVERVFASKAPRAFETAELLAPSRVEIECNNLFREAPLPPPLLMPGLVMRAARWNVISRIFWLFGYADGGEDVHACRKRAGEAAGFLTENAVPGGLTLLAGHGWFNRMLKAPLRKRGWKLRHNGGNRYWSYRIYEKKK